MDDLQQLQSRVEAARERLGGVEADQRKYGLRLDDLVRIVEGALSRQSADLKAARIRAASLETELDDARNTLSRNEVELAAKETDLLRLETQNEQLRSMVMALLELVEGRSTTPLREAMVRLERGVRGLLTETSGKKPTAPAMEPAPAPAVTPAPETPAAPPPPSRPVLVQAQGQSQAMPIQTVHGRVAVPKPAPHPGAEPDAADSEALIELTAVGRGNADETVKEPPEAAAPVAQLLRRMSDAADA